MSTSSLFLVDVDGARLPDDVQSLLVSAFVDDSQRLPDMFEIRFRDPDQVVLAKTGAKVGSTVRISVTSDTSQSAHLLMVGDVTALEAEFDIAGTFTIIRGYDPAHRLFRGRGTYSYSQMTASDIATKVAQRAGLRIGTVAATTTVYEHVSQAGTSDWDLLDALARDAGYEIAVREDGFTFTPPAKAADAPDGQGADQAEIEPLILQLGTDLLRFRSVITSSGQVKDVEVRGWDVATKQALHATVPATTQAAELSTSPQQLAAAFGDPTYVSTDVPHRQQAEVDTAADVLSERIAGAFAECEGVTLGNPAVRAGTAVRLENLGDAFSGKYTVTRSVHRYDPSAGYTTTFYVTGAHDRSLLSLAGGTAHRPSAPAGVVIGVVSDVSDPEQQGRVTLTFPWMSDDYVSGWARTVQAGAGKDRGAMVLPEVGDEVLVAFELGDIRRPYVLGGLYNGIDTPSTRSVPWVDDGTGAVNRRSLVSRNGHRIDLLDQDGAADGVSLSSSDDSLSVVLDATNTTIKVRSDGTVAIEGARGVVVDAGSAPLDLKGGDVSIEAAGRLAITGTTTSLKGSSLAEISGSLVKIN